MNLYTILAHVQDVSSGNGAEPYQSMSCSGMFSWLFPILLLVGLLLLILRSGRFKKRFEAVDKSVAHMKLAEDHIAKADAHMSKMEDTSARMLEELKAIRANLERK